MEVGVTMIVVDSVIVKVDSGVSIVVEDSMMEVGEIKGVDSITTAVFPVPV